MKRFIRSKKGISALLATMVVVGASAFGAYAYFTNTGSQAGTPVTVGDQSPNLAIAFNSVISGATLATAATTYTNGNSALLPTIIGDTNKDVATVPFTITNGSESQELLTSYTVSIDSAWFNCTDGTTALQLAANSGACNDHSVPCTAADFSINPGGSNGAGDSPVLVTGTENGSNAATASPALPVELKPASDAPANTYASTFTVQLVDLAHNHDNCIDQVPAMHVSATS